MDTLHPCLHTPRSLSKAGVVDELVAHLGARRSLAARRRAAYSRLARVILDETPRAQPLRPGPAERLGALVAAA